MQLARLASKKGIAITAGIAAAIVGSSFLIWFLPQQQGPSVMQIDSASDYSFISDIYSRHNALADQIQIKYSQWKNGTLSSTNMSAQIVSAKSDVQNMLQSVTQARPATQWQASYTSYGKALEAFSSYLDALEARVKSGDRSGSDASLAAMKESSNRYVDEAVNSMPISG